MKKFFVFLGVLCLPLVALAETTVRFEPATVSLGESTELVIETDRPLTAEPDLSALAGSFAVAGQQQGMRTVSVNGKRRTKYRLALNVFPRKEGELSTGNIVINGVQVKPAVLTVTPAGTNPNLPITLEAFANQSTVYPDETFLLTIKLTHGVALLDAKIMTPTLENAKMVLLDMDKTTQEYKAGRPVYVYERTFAVTPEKPGYLTVPPLEVYGLVADRDNQNDLFSGNILFDGLLGGQKEIRLASNPVQVTVLEKPADWSGWWLPATQVSLGAQDTFPDQINVGDSLTRNIKLTALGVVAEKLPVPKQNAVGGIKVYPSPEQRETLQTPVGDIQGVVSVSYILVPAKAGNLTLPEVRVPWFNTQTRQMEEAVIPPKVITVLGDAAQAMPDEKAATPAPQKEKKKAAAPKKQQKATPTQTPAPEAPKNGRPIYWIIGSSLLALGIGLGLGFLLFRRKKHRSYRLPDADQKKKKKKKPLPDLYPF